MDEKKREEIALFRFSLIVPFLTQEELEWGIKGEILQRMVKTIQTIPHSKKTSLNQSTIRRYLADYRDHGFDGLKPKDRSDIGSSNKIPTDMLEKAFLLKREEPRRSTRKIIQIMEAHKWIDPGLIKPSTLYRQLKQNNLTYKQLKTAKKQFRPFQADHPNQIWQSDTMFGPYLPDPDRPEAKKRTYLVATLDDCSRLIPHGEFYWHERLPCLENTLQKAILKRGIPEVLYVDNGKVYSAHQINAICAELGIRKITCKPYSPEAKGKIERFFGTVRSDFLTELQLEKVATLEQLNSKFWAWLEVEYHEKRHSSTDDSPNSLWRNQVNPYLKKIDEKQLQAIFLWREKRKVNKLGLITVAGIQFELSSFLKDQTVEVRYNHFDLSEVFIYQDGRLLQKARTFQISRWNSAHKQKPATPEPLPASGVKHLEHLEQQHQQLKIQQAQQLLRPAAAASSSGNTYTEAHFIKDFAIVLKRKVETLHATELQELQAAWAQFGPFKPDLVNIALSKATITKGIDQHVSFYLKTIIESHVKQQQKNNQSK